MKYNDFNGKRYDCHGKTVYEFESLIDQLSQSNEIVQIVTGSGKGLLKEKLRELQKLYHFRILQTSHNDASFIVDFTD
jgi:dsDNA-specific endonuclease/ATPase MutS2